MLKCRSPGSRPPGVLPQWLWAGVLEPEFFTSWVLILQHVRLQEFWGLLACLVEVKVLLTGYWATPAPEPQDTRGYLHTCWFVLLHQKPAGSMEAELTVGIRTVIKIRHHSCSHGWICWGEKRHLAQTYSPGRYTCCPPPAWRSRALRAGISGPSTALTSTSQPRTSNSYTACFPAGLYLFIYLCRKQNNLSTRLCESEMSEPSYYSEPTIPKWPIFAFLQSDGDLFF